MDDDEKLINEAHDLFGEYSIFEVFDLDRPDAFEMMKELYGNGVDLEKVDRYLDVLEELRALPG
jgi:hypothetical protein